MRKLLTILIVLTTLGGAFADSVTPNSIGGTTTVTTDFWGNVVEQVDTDSQGRVRQRCRHLSNPDRIATTYYRADGSRWRDRVTYVGSYDMWDALSDTWNSEWGEVPEYDIDDLEPESGPTPEGWGTDGGVTYEYYYDENGARVFFRRIRFEMMENGWMRTYEWEHSFDNENWNEGPGVSPHEERQQRRRQAEREEQDQPESNDLTQRPVRGSFGAEQGSQRATGLTHSTVNASLGGHGGGCKF